jgi:hypothetical protein
MRIKYRFFKIDINDIDTTWAVDVDDTTYNCIRFKTYYDNIKCNIALYASGTIIIDLSTYIWYSPELVDYVLSLCGIKHRVEFYKLKNKIYVNVTSKCNKLYYKNISGYSLRNLYNKISDLLITHKLLCLVCILPNDIIGVILQYYLQLTF